MQAPQGMQQILQLLTGGDASGVKQLEARARRGQMTFAATQYAVKSGCSCEACVFLRKAVEEEYEEARREAGIHDPSDHPIEGEGTPVPRARTAGDTGGSDLPDRAPAAPDGVPPRSSV